jgi:hypothetical protein
MQWTALLATLLLFAERTAALTAREIISQAQARNGFAEWRDRKMVVRFQSSEYGAGVTREAEIYERDDPRREHRSLIVIISPDTVRGIRFLHVSARATGDMWWTWSPTLRRPLKLGGTPGATQGDESFFGPDLSYGDVEAVERVLQWTDAEGAVTSESEEACGEKTCDRVVVVPAKGNDEFPYRRYRLWFSRDDLLLRRAELYDIENRLMKTVDCGGYFASGRFMTPRECVIVHVNGGRSTIAVREVTYDSGLAESLFAIGHLPDGGRRVGDGGP